MESVLLLVIAALIGLAVWSLKKWMTGLESKLDTVIENQDRIQRDQWSAINDNRSGIARNTAWISELRGRMMQARNARTGTE